MINLFQGEERFRHETKTMIQSKSAGVLMHDPQLDFPNAKRGVGPFHKSVDGNPHHPWGSVRLATHDVVDLAGPMGKVEAGQANMTNEPSCDINKKQHSVRAFEQQPISPKSCARVGDAKQPGESLAVFCAPSRHQGNLVVVPKAIDGERSQKRRWRDPRQGTKRFQSERLALHLPKGFSDTLLDGHHFPNGRVQPPLAAGCAAGSHCGRPL